jgi:predicted outer membrane repeat protein
MSGSALTIATITITSNQGTGGNGGSYGGRTGNGDGGGLYNLGPLTVSHSTLSANSASHQGGGISTSGGTLRVQNTIVAGNRSPRSPDIQGSVSSTSSYNLVGDGTGLSGISDGVNHNQIGISASPIDPRLSPFGDHGGPTQTYALLPGSPALDAGDPSQSGTPDQRGVIRSSGVNIGSFQASAASFVVVAPDSVTAGDRFDVSVSAPDPFGQPAVGYTGTVSFSSADPLGASLPPAYTFTLADAGSHTFAGLSSLYTAGTWDVTATDPVNNVSGSANVNVNAGMAVAFRVVAPANATSGTPFDIAVLAIDTFGNVDTHYTGTIHLSTSDTDPGVVLPMDYQFVAGDNGTHTFPAGVTLITPDDQTLTVTDLTSGITGSAVVTL